MKRLFVMALALFLAACTSAPKEATERGSVIQIKPDGTRIENRSDYATYQNGRLEELKATPKVKFELEAIDGQEVKLSGVKRISLEVPMVGATGAAAGIQPPTPEPEEESLAKTVVKETAGVAKELIQQTPVVAAASVVNTALKKNNSTTNVKKTNNTHVTASGPGAAASAGGNAQGSNSRNSTRTTTTTTTTNNNTNSNNPTTNSNNNNSNQNNTGTPTP
jgi:hypothetical protein